MSKPFVQLVIFWFFCLSFVQATALGNSAIANRPNVVFILIDDMGWRDLQCYGSDLYETPYIDAFANTAMRFTNAYSASPLCSPTRASILTGQEPGRLRLTTPNCHTPKVLLDPKETHTAQAQHRATVPQSSTRLKNSYTTIAESFKALGYQTAFMGKWHLGHEPYVPDMQGFDLVVGGREHPGPPGGYFAPWPCPTLPPEPAGTHICDALTDTAMSYISHKREEPFMLCLWYYDVHAPFQAKKNLIAKYESKINDKHIQRNAIMGAMVETLDANLGRFFAKMTELGLDENTIVVFTSDNGGNMYNCPEGEVATNNYPLREGKGNNYEGGVRVPLMVRVPQLTKPNSVSHVVTSTVDHYTSLMELVGSAMPDSVVTDGQSYVPALKGETYDRAPVYSAFCHRTPKAGNIPNISMRDKAWKLYRFYYDGEGDEHRYELYNLEKDISEKHNLAKQYPARLAKMIAQLDTHIAEAGYLQSQKNKRYTGNAVGQWWGAEDMDLSVIDSVMYIQAKDAMPYIETDMIPGISKQQIYISFDMKSSAAGAAKVAWVADRKAAYSAADEQAFEVIHDGLWHHYRVPVFIDKISKLRIMPCTAQGEVAFKNLMMENSDGYPLRTWSLSF